MGVDIRPETVVTAWQPCGAIAAEVGQKGLDQAIGQALPAAMAQKLPRPHGHQATPRRRAWSSSKIQFRSRGGGSGLQGVFLLQRQGGAGGLRVSFRSEPDAWAVCRGRRWFLEGDQINGQEVAQHWSSESLSLPWRVQLALRLVVSNGQRKAREGLGEFLMQLAILRCRQLSRAARKDQDRASVRSMTTSPVLLCVIHGWIKEGLIRFRRRWRPLGDAITQGKGGVIRGLGM